MIADDYSTIDLALERYRFFEECLLETLRLSHFGTALELDFQYIWDDNERSSQKVVERPVMVRLVLHGLEEACIVTALPPSVRENPENADWGLTEVAIARLVRDSDLLAKHHDAGRPLHHLAVEWESDRRIDVVFERLELRAPFTPS